MLLMLHGAVPGDDLAEMSVAGGDGDDGGVVRGSRSGSVSLTPCSLEDDDGMAGKRGSGWLAVAVQLSVLGTYWIGLDWNVRYALDDDEQSSSPLSSAKNGG
jgi:hypothetical protein